MASQPVLYNPPSMSTPLPPQQLVAPTMSTPLPPQQVTAPPMSTPLPPQVVPNPTLNLTQYSPANVVGGINAQLGNANLPNAGTVVGGLQAQLGYNPDGTPIQQVQGINNAFRQPTLPGATATTMSALNTLLSGENSYIANARRRGLETANRRGLLNSTIASGASERAAIESSMPILGEIMGLTRQREGQDFQSLMASRGAALGLTEQQNAAKIQEARDAFQLAGTLTGQDRAAAYERAQNLVNQAIGLTDSRESRALDQQQFEQTQQFNREQMREQAVLEDWMSSNQFNRQFNANLAMLPINNTFDLLQNLMQYGAENPQVWTPDIISGTSNFFTNNMFDILNRYFPGSFTGAQAGGG